VIGFYGVYDLFAQWEHDQITRSGDQFTEKFLGTPPRHNRRVYFDASPISYATTDRNTTKFLLIDGTHDDIVDVKTQGAAFLSALKNANFFARSLAVPGAGHFWIVDPIEEAGSYCGFVAPRILRFLKEHL
jgi:dipeptidyl aminopeptidase/acylaminoacyl peptidase